MQAGFPRLVVMSGKEVGSCREGRDGRWVRTCGIISPVFFLSSSAQLSSGLQAEFGLLGVAHPDCATHQGAADENVSARLNRAPLQADLRCIY